MIATLISYLRSLARFEHGEGTGYFLTAEPSDSDTIMPGETKLPGTLVLPGEEVGPGHQLTQDGPFPAADYASPGETIAQLVSPGEIASAISFWRSADAGTMYGEPTSVISNLVLPGEVPLSVQMTLPGEAVAMFDLYAPVIGLAGAPGDVSSPGETLLDGDYSGWLDTEQYHAAVAGYSPAAEPEPGSVPQSPARLIQLLDYIL